MTEPAAFLPCIDIRPLNGPERLMMEERSFTTTSLEDWALICFRYGFLQSFGKDRLSAAVLRGLAMAEEEYMLRLAVLRPATEEELRLKQCVLRIVPQPRSDNLSVMLEAALAADAVALGGAKAIDLGAANCRTSN